MISIDVIKQLNADAFNLIAAGTCKRRIADPVEIGIDEFRAQLPHRKTRAVDMTPDFLAVAGHRNRADQFMGPAAQPIELLFGLMAIAWFIENLPVQIENLIGADHQLVRIFLRYMACLLRRQDPGNAGSAGCRAVALKFPFYRALIYFSADDVARNSGARQHLSADFTSRSQYYGFEFHV